MKIHSKYLNRDFEIKNEKVSHEELEDIIINELRLGYKFDIEEIDDHPAVLCTIKDKDDRYIQAIGEADEDEKYPTVLAGMRAFDKAALLYLNIEVPVSETISYTEEEEEEVGIVAAPIIVDEEDEDETDNKSEETEKNEEAEKVEDAEAETETATVDEPKEEANAETQDAPEETAVEPDFEAAPEFKEETENEPVIEPEVAAAPVELKFDDPVITIGKKYGGKGKKVSELMKEDIGWINYIITHMTNVTGDYKKQVDAMREQILLVDLNTISDVKLRENVAATIELVKSK